MKEFEKREAEGRFQMLSLVMMDILRGDRAITFTPITEHHDFDMTSFTPTIRTSKGEIKCIHRNYDDYPNFQIDYAKVRDLKVNAGKEGKTPYLICFFNDCSICWDLTNIDLDGRVYKQMCTRSTATDYSRGAVEKEEVWLTKEEAIWSRENI